MILIRPFLAQPAGTGMPGYTCARRVSGGWTRAIHASILGGTIADEDSDDPADP